MERPTLMSGETGSFSGKGVIKFLSGAFGPVKEVRKLLWVGVGGGGGWGRIIGRNNDCQKGLGLHFTRNCLGITLKI